VVFNNMTFAGSQARTYEQAIESAASLALFNLVGYLTASCQNSSRSVFFCGRIMLLRKFSVLSLFMKTSFVLFGTGMKVNVLRIDGYVVSMTKCW